MQPDPLSPPQPANTNPPAGDLSSLLQDPTSDSGAFSGGPRGQGGTGSGPMIGGTGKGGSGASRAYAELVQRALMRQLRKRPNLAQASFQFRVRVRVSGSGSSKSRSCRASARPISRPNCSRRCAGWAGSTRRRPPGVPNQITLQLNQA